MHNQKQELAAKNVGNAAMIDDLQQEIRLLKEKTRILEEQLDQAKKQARMKSEIFFLNWKKLKKIFLPEKRCFAMFKH